MKIYSLLIVTMLIGFSCQQNKSGNTTESGFHGDEFSIEESISVVAMMKQLDEKQPITDMVVSGEVVEVCQAKGCWLTLKTDQDENVRVTFKDYGFFVPKDLSGKEVVIKGEGKIETTSVADLQHFAEDEGLSKEKIAEITEPLEEYTFVASGVKIK